MHYSLNQSVAKFRGLRKKLRQLTGYEGNLSLEKNECRKQPDFKQQSNELKKSISKVNENKNEAPSVLQETERKRRKSQIKWFSNDQRIIFQKQNKASQSNKYQMVIQKGQKSDLLSKKQQTLNEINELLQKKRKVLDDLEMRLLKQAKTKDEIFSVASSSLNSSQALNETRMTLKAPDLLKIREERKKLKQRENKCKKQY